MAAFLRYLGLAVLLTLVSASAHAAPATTNQPSGFHLTVDLRDGSRIIGRSDEESFVFRSDVLGETKLALRKIRCIDCDPVTNLVTVTTVSADSLKVAFVTKDIHLTTGFGEINLPVSLIKSVKVSVFVNSGRPRSGLIGLWSGEGNGIDSVGGNNGVLQNVGFVSGVAGQAFSFAPSGGFVGVQIADKPAYQLTNSLTIDCWVRPRGHGYVIFYRGDGRTSYDPYCLSFDGQLNLQFAICDPQNNSALVKTRAGLGAWIHVAGILDGSTGTMSLYTNGVLASQTITTVRPLGALVPEASPGVGIGNVNDGFNNLPFIGDIDEVALYDRALSPEEVNAIYAENAANAEERAEVYSAGRNPAYFKSRSNIDN